MFGTFSFQLEDLNQQMEQVPKYKKKTDNWYFIFTVPDLPTNFNLFMLIGNALDNMFYIKFRRMQTMLPFKQNQSHLISLRRIAEYMSLKR